MRCDICHVRTSQFTSSREMPNGSSESLYLCAECAAELEEVLTISDYLSDKALTYGESSYGATKVILVLRDGRKIPDVTLAGRDIVKIGRQFIKSKNQLTFLINDIIDVLPEKL